METLCTYFLCAVGVWGGEAPPRAITIDQLVAVGTPYTNKAEPAAVQIEDVERWARMLDADADQHKTMLQQYATFVDEHNQFMESDGRAYLEACARIARLQMRDNVPTLDSPDFVDALKSYGGRTSRFQAELESRENAYIDAIASLLTEEQADRIYLLRQEASRRQSRSFHHRSRWTPVDLRLVWEAMWSASISAEDNEAMADVLAAHEAEVTLLLSRGLVKYWDLVVELPALFAQSSAGQIDSVAMERAYQALWNAHGDALRRVRESTERCVEHAATVLSPVTAKQFVAEAKAAAFPEIYPDETNYDQLFENILLTLDDEAKLERDVRELRLGYRSEYTAICDELESLCVEWGDQLSRGVNGYQPQYLFGALKPLIARRETVSQQWLERLTELVGEDVIEGHMPEPPSLQRTPAQLRAVSAGQVVRPNPRAPIVPEHLLTRPARERRESSSD